MFSAFLLLTNWYWNVAFLQLSVGLCVAYAARIEVANLSQFGHSEERKFVNNGRGKVKMRVLKKQMNS